MKGWMQEKQAFFRISSCSLMLILGLVLTYAILTPTGQAAFPGNNGKIAYNASYDIYVMDADGTGQVRLATNTVSGGTHSWSPDGTQIAFTSNSDGTFEIYKMNADGTGQTRLTNDTAQDSHPAWSPDGSKIAFVRYDGPVFYGSYYIYTMNADGSGQTRLTSTPVKADKIAWSPDGSRIAFVGNLGAGFGICLTNADGTGQIMLTGESYDGYPTWSPDGSRIAFNRRYGDLYSGSTDICVMNADGTGQTRLTSGPVYKVNSKPDWSPDGFRIAFISTRDHNGFSGNFEIYVMNADGTGQTRLTSNSVDELSPAWQPLPCSGSAPTLSLGMTNAYWGSYADYTAGLLSVDYIMSNGGSICASSAAIIGSVDTNGVTLSGALPIAVGSIAVGGSAPATVKYIVPAGVGAFKSTLYATAKDACGASHSYPGPMPGA